jgi:hypothetical protein
VVFRLTVYRLEKASSDEPLSQETIIQNLDPKEAQRLSRVRNIGIAVGCANLASMLDANVNRRI